MTEPRWLTRAVVLALHEESVAQFGGAAGIRDEGLLESALGRPRHRWSFDDTASVPELAAYYGIGIIRNHPFLDGNKRAGLLCIAVFLRLNAFSFEPDEADEVRAILALAAGSTSDGDFVAWVRRNATPIRD